jgi:hypothetical protein
MKTKDNIKCRQAGKTLELENLKAEDFARATLTIYAEADTIADWRKPIEQAYHRLSPKAQRKVRFHMLSLYYSLNLLHEAAKYAHPSFRSAKSSIPSELLDPADLIFSLEAYQEIGDKKAAHRAAQAAETILPKTKQLHEKAGLLQALAWHYAFTEKRQERSRVEKLLHDMPAKDECFGCNKFTDIGIYNLHRVTEILREGEEQLTAILRKAKGSSVEQKRYKEIMTEELARVCRFRRELKTLIDDIWSEKVSK